MDYENTIRSAANHIGPPAAATADAIVRAMRGEVGHCPTIAIDFARRARRRLGNRQLPTAAEVLDIIKRGEK